MKSFFRNPLFQGLSLLGLYFFTGRLGMHVRTISGSSATIWFPSGVGLASVLLLGEQALVWVVIASFLLNLHAHMPAAALVLSLVNAFDTWVGAKLTRKFVSEKPSLSTVREVLTFVIVVCVSAAFGSAALLTARMAVGEISPQEVLDGWRPWWLAAAAGQLFVAGAFLAWQNSRPLRPGMASRQKWEFAGLVAALVVVAALNYTPLAQAYRFVFLRPYTLFPLMIWAALRFDLLGVTLAGLIVVVVWFTGTAQGFVPPTTLPPAEGLVLQQGFLMAWGTVGFILAAAVREKQEAIDARSDFLSVASHELKTPVTSVLLQLQLYQRQLLAQADRSKEQDKWLESFRRAGTQMVRLGRLVDQLMDMSRIDRRDFGLKYEAVDLAALVQSLIERSTADLSRARCPIELSLTHGVSGRWDSMRVEQVLENLVSNAIKYAPGAPIRIATAVTGNSVEIEVSDRGPGIAETEQSRIFERFFRAEGSRSGTRGLGLGLFISREIVRAHHGSISVNSAPGEGARFRIRMPLDPEAVTGS